MPRIADLLRSAEQFRRAVRRAYGPAALHAEDPHIQAVWTAEKELREVANRARMLVMGS